jgi:Tol biopolymer transport system component
MRVLRYAAAAASAVLLFVTLSAQDGAGLDVDLQRAIQQEMVTGDLKGVIAEYERIVARAAGADRSIAVQALMRMAESYRKLGDAEATKIYERIVREYADHPDAVAAARARLGHAEAGSVREPVTLRKVWDGDISGTISRDGRRLSYVDWGAGHLAVRDLHNGATRAVTEGDYNVYEPSMSNDGTQVAYTWASGTLLELRIARVLPDSVSPARRLFASHDVTWISPMDWSPDGRTIAVTLQRKDQTAQIGLVTVPEGTLRVLKSVDWRGPTRVFFSPDGRYLGFDVPASDTSDERDVFVLAVDGSREVPAVVHPGQDVMMGWSPNGRHLLFASDRRDGALGLWALPMADGRPRGNPGLVKASIGTGWSLGVSGQGTVYLGTRAGDGDVAVASIDFTTGRQVGPATRPIQHFIGANAQPHWSPDGKSLAYASYRGFSPSNNFGRILVIQSVATGDVHEIRPKLSYFNQYTWSPDGRTLLTGGTNLRGRSGVFRIDAQTGEVVQIVEVPSNGGNAYPQSSPDGRRIYYRPQHTGNPGYSIVERDLATGQERELIADVTNGPINLSPDGLWIATGKRLPSAAGASTLASAIVLIPVAGGEPRELLRAAPDERFGNYQGMPWTPDGRAFLVKKVLPKGSELWLVPITGEPPRRLDVDISGWSGGPFGAPSLHPDGRQLAFVQRSSEPTTQVWALENFLPALK